MIKFLTNCFRSKKATKPEYTGLSDFFLNASPKEQKEVLTKAARKANEDQLRVFTEVRR